MDFRIFGKEGAPTIMLIPGLGVSYEMFLPLIGILEDKFQIIAVQVDGFTLGRNTEFTSVDDQAIQAINYIKENFDGNIDVAYGLSLGGKILSQILERNEVNIRHAIMDAAPLLPLPRWLVSPLKYLQCANVWTCYHWTGFWRWVFHSHYFDVLLDECRKIYPSGGSKAVLDGYTSAYTTKLESISGNDIHYWYGTKEAFVAKPQVKHLKKLYPNTNVEVFKGMNHGQLLIDHPEEVAKRIKQIRCDKKIVELSERTDLLIEQLTQVWEKSVKATHLFLSNDKIAEIKKFVPGALSEVTNLIVSINDMGEPIGFMGVEDSKIEMLFISPDERGKGIGKAFIECGIEHFAANQVTVNEQNPQALGFYEHLGFSVYKRTETDEEGRPYPLLYMKR